MSLSAHEALYFIKRVNRINNVSVIKASIRKLGLSSPQCELRLLLCVFGHSGEFRDQAWVSEAWPPLGPSRGRGEFVPTASVKYS